MNKKFLVSILMVATVFSCIGLTGCGKAKETTTPAKQEQKQVKQEDSSKKIAESIKFETKDETACYRVFGEKNDKKVYYTMDMPQAKEVSKFIFNYMKLGINIDYKTVKNDPQFPHYSQKLQKKYGGNEHSNQVVANSYKKMELSEVFTGIEKYNYIKFNKDFTACDISVNRLLLFKHFAKDSTFAEAGVKYNQMYTQEAKYKLLLENGKWKVEEEIIDTVLYPYEPELSK